MRTSTRNDIGLSAVDGAYMMGYSADGRALTIDTSTLCRETRPGCGGFDPRTGQATDAGNQAALGAVTKKPPSGQDWVLVADDAARGFPRTG